ncbi:MAG TPA: HAD-IA family hydrolase [Tepidiformaceae bacterium]|nr:HAD-IA family hydrolase [Tepidiformaceae bacterium]
MRAVLWDLDDTVLDTLPGRMAALRHAYSTCMGSLCDPAELWRSHRGGTLEDLGRKLLGDGYQRFTTTYRDHYYNGDRSNIRPFAGVPEILAYCLERDLPMAIVTSKLSWVATEELVQCGMLQYFKCVVGSDDTDLHKPDPEPIYEALARLCLDIAATDDILFIGDSPADVFAARNAGCRSLAAAWGTLDADLLRDAYPDHFAQTAPDALRVISSALEAASWK